MERALPLPEEQPLCKPATVAGALDCCTDTVYAMAARGELDAIRVGRKLMFPTAALRQRLGLDAPAPAA